MANFFVTAFQNLIRHFGILSALALLIIAAAEKVTGLLQDLLVSLTSLIESNLGVSDPNFGLISEYVGLVNHLFPLSEAVAMLTTYFSLYVLLLTVRWIKSFIPTLAN